MNWPLLVIAVIFVATVIISWKHHALEGVARILPGAAVLGLTVAKALTIPDASRYIVAAGGGVLAGTVWAILLRVWWREATIVTAGAIAVAIAMTVAQSLPEPAGFIVAAIGGVLFGISVMVARKRSARR